MYKINKANQNNEPLIVIFIDLSKAFDSVNLDILSHKLYNLGFRGNFHTFIESYLHNRSHKKNQ